MRLPASLLFAGLALAAPATAAQPATGQIPTRFELPVCPAVYGVAPQQAAYIADRMRRIAGAAALFPTDDRHKGDADGFACLTKGDAGFLADALSLGRARQ